MDSRSPALRADALIQMLKGSLSSTGASSTDIVVLYTTFGVVRGRAGLAFANGMPERDNSASTDQAIADTVEVTGATVEHYSNHLAPATFDRLYVRLSDVVGFAFVRQAG